MKSARLSLCFFIFSAGCEVSTTEYRTRPTWQESMGSDLPTQSMRSDGTIMKFSSGGNQTSSAFDEYIKTIKLIEKDEVTGKTTLRAILPEHVFMQTLTCLRDRNWDLLYDQILSERARKHFEEENGAHEEFNTFFEENRQDIAKTLQRLLRGTGNGDVLTNEHGNKVVYYFSNRVGIDYAFKTVTLVQVNQLLKLDNIE